MNKTLRPLLLAAAAILLMASASVATPSIDIASFGNGVAFSTDFAYGEAWIRVTGPNSYVQEAKIGSLDDLAFVLDGAVADGRYGWEILAVQPIGATLRAKLAASAVAGDRGIVDRLKASGELQSATFYGTFQVRDGAIELPTKSYSTSDMDIHLKAQVFADDLIVQGSACVGFDCESTESFGSDTLRLKENNLRIHFEDTSSTGSFPSNDWRLIANDSSNGGLNHFSIEDSTAGQVPFRIEAGAGANALYVDDSGRVGVGTSGPVTAIHIVDGNSPALRLEQDGSGGFESQVWDLAGNETNFFIRDVTNGSRLPLRIAPGALQDTLFLNSTGVGFNTNDPQTKLHVRGGGSPHTPSNSAVMALFQNNEAATDGAIVSILAGNGTANAQLFFGDADNDNAGRVIYRNGVDAMSFFTNDAERFLIESDGGICIGCNDAQGDAIRHSNGAHLTSGGTWTNASSRALKQDIAELSAADAVAALGELAPVTFRYKAEQDETYVGFIAEEVPELVAMKNRKSLTSMDVVAVLTKVVQEQQKAIDALTARLESQDDIE